MAFKLTPMDCSAVSDAKIWKIEAVSGKTKESGKYVFLATFLFPVCENLQRKFLDFGILLFSLDGDFALLFWCVCLVFFGIWWGVCLGCLLGGGDFGIFW